jgi:hypothetical protein
MPMKFLMVTSAVAAIALSQAAFAQSPKPNSQATQPSTANATQNPNPAATQQQIQNDLKNAGFTDVKVVAESFVVQAKTKDGNPVVMTIGPHGMSAFEAMNSGSGPNSQSGTTGQAGTPHGTKF